MSIFLMILLSAAAGFALDELFFINDYDSDDYRPENDGDVVRVDTGLTHVGGEGSEAYVYAPEASGGISASIDAGGGDDFIDLASLFGNPEMFGSDIAGGAGDDHISVTGESNTIDGGAGDDTINAELFTSDVGGGAGDDLIRVVAGDSNPTAVSGGTGNGTIDVTDSANVVARGEDGDDLLISDGRTTIGTGYAINVDGGVGDDTLGHNADVFP